MITATAYWRTGPGRGEFRRENLGNPPAGAALVETLYTGISPGTERLVSQGRVPTGVADVMRAPFQEGTFPFPVKYGYLAVGVVHTGPRALVGERVFCLHPHQDRFIVPAEALQVIPAAVPSDRAVLAGALQTAVNAVWDWPPLLGDRVAVVGAGLIGACLAAVLRTFPLARLQLVDPDERTRPPATALDLDHVHPQDAAGDCDIVFHTSATPAGLALGLSLLRPERSLVELSWYGTSDPQVPLGGAFHANRLSIRASQVSTLASAHRPGRTRQDQWDAVFDLLTDPRFDALVGPPVPFSEMPHLAAQEFPGLLPLVRYPPTSSRASVRESPVVET